jgi:hypothetical protein
VRLTACGPSVTPWSATSSLAPGAVASSPSRRNVRCRGSEKTAGPKNFSASPLRTAPNQVSRSRISAAERNVVVVAALAFPGAVGTSTPLPAPR